MGLTLGTNAGFVEVAPDADPTGASQSISDNAIAIKNTAPAGASSVTEIGWWVATAPVDTQTVSVAIYTHDSGSDYPDAVIGSIDTSETVSYGDGGTWKKTTGLSIPIMGETTYWIALNVNKTGALSFYCDKGTLTGSRWAFKAAQDALADPFASGGSTNNDYGIALYAIYTTGAAGTNMQINIGDAWKDVSSMQINIGDAWKDVASAQINIGDVWKTIF